jgi:catechol 2,3-dioxygenase-like lactoylglutathione lyase family enzyme
MRSLGPSGNARRLCEAKNGSRSRPHQARHAAQTGRTVRCPLRSPERAARRNPVAGCDRTFWRHQPDNLPTAAPRVAYHSPGHVVDHLALALADLAGTLKRLEGAGVKVLRGPHRFGKGPGTAALIEGPDSIAIELVERP